MLGSEKRGFPSLRELVVAGLLALPLLVTASTIEAADWVDGLPSLKLVAVVSLVFWVLLARSGVPWWLGHSVALVGGLIAALLLGALTITGSGGLGGLLGDLGSWFGDIGSKDGNRGTSITGVILIAVTLWMGYASAWLAYRRSSSLPAALPGLAVLLVVLTFLSSDYYWYFFMYMLAAAPGVIYRHKGRWAAPGYRTSLVGSLVAGAVLMGLSLAPVWKIPVPEGTVIPLSSAFEDSWYSFTESWSSLFHGVPDRKDLRFFSPPRDLDMAGPPSLNSDVLLQVESAQPGVEVPSGGANGAFRWRMRVYDTYNGAGWETVDDAPKVEMSDALSLREFAQQLEDRQEVQADVRIYSKANTLITVGDPVDSSISSRVELSPNPEFQLSLSGPQIGYIPPDMEEYRRLVLPLREYGGSDKPVSEIQGDLRELGYSIVTDPSADQAVPYVDVRRKEAGPESAASLLGSRILVPPRRYTTVGSISTASPAKLRETGQGYPKWVTDRYLQLPRDFPQTVKALASLLARTAANPYDKAEAIRRHLITLPYTDDVGVPPPGQDWIEYFLFVQQKGFCQNYASAMVTMLRSLGIPARLVVGFAPGIWDEDREVWEVQARHYHAWPEVYFPRYGWVEFEPTPADVQPSLLNLGIPVQGAGPGGRVQLDLCQEFEEELALDFCTEDDETLADLAGEIAEDPLVDPELVGTGLVGGRGFATDSSWFIAAIALAAVTLVTIIYGWWASSQYDRVTFTYASMSFLGRLAGVGRRSQDTPWEYNARLVRHFPRHADAITFLTRRFVERRYGGAGDSLDADDTRSLRSGWRGVRNALLARALGRLLPVRRTQPALGLD